jgi:uncharacterized membrane protein YhiD involved in acid resistance
MSRWEIALRIAMALLVGTVIGVERERKNRPAGMRHMYWYAWAPASSR